MLYNHPSLLFVVLRSVFNDAFIVALFAIVLLTNGFCSCCWPLLPLVVGVAVVVLLFL